MSIVFGGMYNEKTGKYEAVVEGIRPSVSYEENESSPDTSNDSEPDVMIYNLIQVKSEDDKTFVYDINTINNTIDDVLEFISKRPGQKGLIRKTYKEVLGKSYEEIIDRILQIAKDLDAILPDSFKESFTKTVIGTHQPITNISNKAPVLVEPKTGREIAEAVS